MSKFKKLTDFLKSLKCRLILLCILIGIVPGVLLRAGMLGSYENRAVSIRTSEILSQAKILANQIVSNDYLNNAESESAINVQLEQLSTIYDGRVMIIDEEFHIIKDTYNLDTGKTIISEEVIKSIQGEEISKYDSQNRYIEMTIPLVHVDPETENYNPYIADNLAISFQMQLKAAEYYPGFTRRIYLKGYRYNMHYCPKTLLIEVGAQTNTVSEAMNAMVPLADLLNKVLTAQR